MAANLFPACDAAAVLTSPEVGDVSHPRLVLAVSILASSLAFVDGSVVNVGLPAIGRSLLADAGALQWVVNAYLLPLSALLLVGGAAGDRFGRRRVLILGTVLFALASLACALAPGLAWLIGARFLQGVGAALLMPNSLAILGAAFTGEAKGRAIGTWAAVGAAMGAIGPVLGGGLIDTVGWRAIFLINLPIAAAAVLLAWRFAPADLDGKDRPLDAPGAVFATLGLGALTWGLTIGSGRGGWTASAAAAVVAGAVLLAAFVLVEHRRANRAMMPLGLFASRPFIGLTVLTLLLYGALGATFVLLPYLLIELSHYSGTAAGAALLPLPVMIAVASRWTGRLAARIGPRAPLTLGSLVVAGGFLLALRIHAGGDYWTEVLPAVLVLSLGMSCIAAPLTTAVLGSVDQAHTGAASGFNSAAARTGGLIATALLGSVLAASGGELLDAFRGAMLAGAGAAAVSALCAVSLLGGRPTAAGQPQPTGDDHVR